MANDKRFKVKNGLETQNISFIDTSDNQITVSITDDRISFSGDSGQLFSITDSLTGTIFAVNDISGVPSIEVDDDGTIRFAEISGNVLIGTTTDDGTNRLQIAGGVSATDLSVTNTITGSIDTADKWTTARTLSLTGAVTGSASIDGSGNVSLATTATSDPTLTLNGDVSGSATFTNLGNATLTVTVADDSHNHVISNVDGLQTALDTKYQSGDSISVANITATGYLRGPATFTIDPSAHGDNTGTVVIAGNLQVDGTTTTINSTTVEVDDLNITLASGAANAAAADGAGITIDGASATLTYNGTSDYFAFNKEVYVATDRVFHDGYHPNADKWTTARTLTLSGAVTGSASIDGSGNVSLSTTATSDPTLTLAGDATGSATFTNLGNATLTVTVADDSHNHVISNVDGLQTALDGKLSTTGGTLTGNLTLNSTNPEILFNGTSDSGVDMAIKATPEGLDFYEPEDSNKIHFRIYDDTGVDAPFGYSVNGTQIVNSSRQLTNITYEGSTIWHAGNDGATSGLDADLLDGQHGSYYQPASTALTTSTTFGGDVSGTYNAIVIADDSHNHIISNVDGLQTALDGKLGSTANAVSASKWATARTITLGGVLSGSVSIDGSSNVTLTAAHTSDPTLTLTGDVTGSATFTNLGNATLTVTVADDSHNHVISNVDGLQTALDGKVDLAGDTMTGNLTIDGAKIILESTLDFVSPDTTNTISVNMLNTDTLSFEGDSGQLFSITDSLSGTIFSVNDISGIPSIEVDDDGTIRFAEFSGNVLIGTSTDDGTNRLQVSGGVTATDLTVTNTISGNIDTADKWATARTLSLTGAVTGSASIDGSGNVSLATTATADPTITLTGAVTGSGTMTNLGNVSIATTATADPTLTLAGDASGSATFTNLGNATLTVTIADDSHNHVISNVDGLQTALDAKQDASTALTTSTTFGGDVSGTYNAIVVADDSHNHIIGNVDGLQTALDAKLDATAAAVSADKWTTARTVSLTGAVTGSASVDGSANVSIATTATADPTLTLTGDVTGSATFTNLGNATLTATVADNSHNHSISTISDEHRLFNNMGDNHSTRTDFNAAYDFGWRYVQGATNGPGVNGATQYYSVYAGLGNDYVSTTYGMQQAWPRNVSLPYPTIRFREAGTWGAWQKISAGQADKWTTARTLSLTGAVTGSASIDGSGNVSLATTATSDPTLTLDGDASGSATFTNLGNATLTVTVADDSHNHVISNVDGLQTALDAKQDAATAITTTTTFGGDVSGTYDAIVVADDSHNHIISNVDGLQTALDGKLGSTANAVSASKWATARTVSLTGAVTGSASVDGSANVSIATTHTADPTLTLNGDVSGSATFTNLGNATLTVTVADDSHNHVISNVDGLQTALDAKVAKSGDTMTGDLTIGTGTADTNLHIKKADNNVSDHIIFYNGTTRVGEIGVEDTSWLRLNQETATNIYTPRYIRADGGFFVDGTTYGIDGTGKLLGNAGTVTGNLDVTGDASAANFNSTSDERLKSDIETLDGSKVLKMRGVSFIKDGKPSSGVIAQELEKIAPELVHDGEYKTVSYGNIVGYLIEAIKMQQEVIDKQTESLNSLEKRLAFIERGI